MEFVIFGKDSRRFRCSVRGYYGTVYDQKNEGICLPIAMATATTISYIVKYGYVIDLSPQPFIDLGIHCFRYAKLFITNKNYGLQQHCDYPFIRIPFIRDPGKVRYQTGHRYTLSDAKIIAGYNHIRDAIIHNFSQWGPKYALVASVDLTHFVHDNSTPFRYRGPPPPPPKPNTKNTEDDDPAERNVGHAVVITGLDTSSLYDEEHSVEIKNSYGPTWGQGGYSTVTYHFFQLIFVPVMRGDIKARKQHRHPLDLHTIHHSDSVNGLCFSADGLSLATGVCDDGIVRIFELDDFSSESFRFKSITMRPGCLPTGVVFVGDSSSSIVVATRGTEIYLHMYEENSTGRDFSLKWDKRMAHNENIRTLFGALATDGGEGSTTIVSSDGTDIRLWRGETGKYLGMARVQNNVACISPNGQFVAAASLSIVKVWKIVYSVNSSVSASQVAMDTSFATLECGEEDITWLCFSPDSEWIITATIDGKVRMLHIAAKEEPKALMEFPIPHEDSKDSTTFHYDRLCISPDGKILAAIQASVVQWISIDTGEVLDTADKAHEGDITSISWSPKPLLIGDKRVYVLATSGVDQKVKLWAAPTL